MSSSEEDEVLENKEITEPEVISPEPITRAKKPRSEKQIAALARAREKRAEKIGDRKKIKEAENKLIEDNREMLTQMALGGNIEEQIEDEPLEPPSPAPVKKPRAKKKKKVKKTIVNNYYEEEDSESDEELIEEQNNFYVNNRKGRNRKNIPIAPTTLIFISGEVFNFFL